MATDIPDYAKDDFNAESDASITFSTYPKAETHRPHVIVVGGGVAGMTAAHRLLERGHDVTLLEANAYLGGKLGAHRDRDEASFEKAESTEPQDFSVFGQGQCNPCTTPCCKTMRRHDWHEH